MAWSQLSVEISSEGRGAAPSSRRENKRVGLEGPCHRENQGLPEVTSSTFCTKSKSFCSGLIHSLTSQSEEVLSLRIQCEAGETAQQLRALAALLQAHDVIPSTYMGARDCPLLWFRGSDALF